MKIYFSSLSSFIDDGCNEYFSSIGKKLSLLGSYANDGNYVDYIYNGEIECCDSFMLDSGAVSVRSGKKQVTFEGYINNILNLPKNISVPYVCVGFDVIGDPIASAENYKKMKYEYGIDNFIPVFHYRSDMKYLEALIKEGYTYIGLGGTANKASRKKLSYKDFINWWEDVFFTVSEYGHNLRFPGIKFHGFAVTSERAVNAFPWESVDSTAWIKNSAVGKILTPYGDIRISKERSGTCRLQLARRDPITQEKVIAWLESFGLTLQDVMDNRLAKNIVNISYFLWLQDNHHWDKKKVVKQSFLNLI